MMEALVCLEKLEELVLLDLLDPPVSADLQVKLVQEVNLEPEALLVHLDSVEREDVRVLQELVVSQESVEEMEHLDLVDLQALQDQLGQMENLVSPDQQVLLVSADLLVSVEVLVKLEVLVKAESLVALDLQEELDQLVHQDHRERQDLVVRLEREAEMVVPAVQAVQVNLIYYCWSSKIYFLKIQFRT